MSGSDQQATTGLIEIPPIVPLTGTPINDATPPPVKRTRLEWDRLSGNS